MSESFETTSSTEAISKAAGTSQEVLIFEGIPDGFPSRTPDVAALPDAMQRRCEQSERVSETEILSQGCSLEELRARTERMATNNPSTEWRILAQLGTFSCEQFERSRDASYLDRGIAYLRTALEYCSAVDEGRCKILYNIGVAYHHKFEATGSGEALADGINILRTMPTNSPSTGWRILARLGTLSCEQFERSGDVSHLDSGIAGLRTALEHFSAGNEDRCTILHNIGLAYHRKFEEPVSDEALDDGIDVLRNLLAILDVPGKYEAGRVCVEVLARALGTRYDRSAKRVDLDEAITTLQVVI